MPNDRPRRGRPPIRPGEPAAAVHVRLPVSEFDQVFRLAEKQGCTMPDVARQGIRLLLDREKRKT